MMCRLTRRTFLVTSGAIATALGIAGGIVIVRPVLHAETGVISTLRRCVPGLDMHPDELDAFAGDVIRHRSAVTSRRAVYDVVLAYGPPAWIMPVRLEAAQRREEEEIVTLFMRSTDHLDPARGGAPTQYIAFADPYETGCSNPVPFWAA